MTKAHSEPLLECIPNFSEGVNMAILQKIADSLSSVDGASLLHMDVGSSANRTVMTLAGTPVAVLEATYRGIETAVSLINMEKHQGVHPRMGAVDVCPLVPLQGISMEEVKGLAMKLGKRVGETLGVPVFLYEESASSPSRKSLAFIRKGEYEGIAARMGTPGWKPDFGPHTFNPTAGQIAIGARELMLAYNVNLSTPDARLAHEVAQEVRESGKKVVDPASGKKKQVPGTCKGLKAIGWYMEEYGLAQVSTNITRLAQTNLHQAYQAISDAAERRGLAVIGSELIGMAPLHSFLEAGKYFLQPSVEVDKHTEAELVKAAVEGLGLSTLSPFLAEERIIEYKLKQQST
ncbi:MAG: glutamate formimidoyltransferase [Bacteroidota bacterium]